MKTQLVVLLALLSALLLVGPTNLGLWLVLLPLGVVSLLDEQRISLNELARRENVSPSTCWRWSIRGVRGVKLEVFSVGGRRYTTCEAFERWVAATNSASCGKSTVTALNLRNSEAANADPEKELSAEGL